MSLTLQAQIFDPVTWEFGYEKKGEGNYELIITASLRKDLIFIRWIPLKADPSPHP